VVKTVCYDSVDSIPPPLAGVILLCLQQRDLGIAVPGYTANVAR